MKVIRLVLTWVCFALSTGAIYTQTVGFNYQAVLRNSSYVAIGNTSGTANVSILNDVGTSLYSETHTITTDQLGMFSLVVGKGSSPSIPFSNISWGSGGLFLKVAINANGNNYDFSPSELQAVPYAKVAERTMQALAYDPATGQLSLSNGGGSVNLPAGGGTYVSGPGISIVNNTISNTGDPNAADDITTNTQAGGGLSGFYPMPQLAANAVNSSKIADGSIQAADMAPGVVPQGINDLNDVTTTGAANGQVLKWNGSQWVPQDDNVGGGGGGGGATVTQSPLIGNGSSGSPVTIGQNGATSGQVLKWNGSSWTPANDNGTQYTAGQGININGTTISATDNSATNELQTLSVTSNILSISNGNSVTLPTDPGYFPGPGIIITGNIISNSGDDDNSVFNEIQYLSLSGSTLNLSNGGGSVSIPTYTAGSGISINGNNTITNTGDDDNSSFNEIQSLSLSGSTLYLSNGGGTADLSGLGSNWTLSGSDIYRASGNVGIGTIPSEKLHVAGNIRIGSTLYLGTVESISDGGNFELICNGTVSSTVDGGDNCGASGRRWGSVFAVNGTINTSDARDKSNILGLKYGLEQIMKLRPVSFTWKDHKIQDTKLGLLAQEVQEIIPEVVVDHETKRDEKTGELIKVPANRLGIYYSDLIPVLIKGMQEQQAEIEKLRGENAAIIAEQAGKMEAMEARLAKLEALVMEKK